MTRRVNFSPQQRVDQPDAQAIAAFGNQDMRRYMRQVIMGRDVAANEGRVLAGFKVEPEDPGVSPRVIVKLDLGGGALGAFMGAIDQGGGLIDWGQLAGDKDGLGNLEGSAQNLLDFTGQPVAAYEVKARTAFVPGILDNRAFWNPASNEEFIKPTNTRLLPQWEIAFQNHAGPEWVLLGEVAWGGVSVDTVDITDLRKFPIEGQPRNAATAAEQWSHEDQDDGDDFGVADFDRNEDRGDGGAGLAALWEANRALARQIQDLKGGRESDLRFDWFSRTYAPPGVIATDPATRHTKSLRTVDVVTFTCADGVTEQGDFNGPSAIYECLQFISAAVAELPARIHIVAKSREGAADFTWGNAPLDIVGKHISLIGLGGNLQSFSSIVSLGKGLTTIDPGASTLAAGPLLRISGGGSLHVENIDFEEQPADEVGWIEVELGGRFTCDNITFNAPGASDDPSFGATLRVPSEGLEIKNSLMTGLIFIGGRGDPSAALGDSVAMQDHLWTPGLVQNTLIGGLVRTRFQHFSGTDFKERWIVANKLTWSGCFFLDGVAVHGPVAHGQIDVTGARHMAFDRCDFSYHGDQTCIYGTSLITDDAPFTMHRIEAIDIHDCTFRLTGSGTHEGFITGAGGVDGIEGTGWAVMLAATEAGTDPVNSAQILRQIDISGNRFLGGLETNGVDTADSPADAGAISIRDAAHVWVQKNDFRWWTKPAGALATSDVQTVCRVRSTAAGFALTGGQHTWIEKNFFGDIFTAGGADWNVARFAFIDVVLLNGAEINGNVISARSGSGSLDQRFGALPAALVINTCLGVKTHNNRFVNFRDSVDPLLNTCVGVVGINAGLSFQANEFINCGGANLVFEAGALCVGIAHKDNAYYVGLDSSQFAAAYDEATFGDGSVVCSHTGNYWDSSGSGKPGLNLGPSNVVGMISANAFLGGTITVAGAGGVPFFFLAGYAATTVSDPGGGPHVHTLPMMNLNAGYT